MAEKPPTVDARSNIESVLHEDRKFECPEDFRQQAHIKTLEDYERIYRESVEQPEKFWGGIASELKEAWSEPMIWTNSNRIRGSNGWTSGQEVAKSISIRL